MALLTSYFKKTFRFGFDARTSRGLMKDKVSWFICIRDERDLTKTGIGECGPLPGLSVDDVPGFEEVLTNTLREIASLAHNEIPDEGMLNEIVPRDFPSILFGLETAVLDLENGGRRILFENDFLNGKPIPINGLIWMGDTDFMLKQIDEKIALGFRCIKLKVGGLRFDKEMKVLAYIRDKYPDEGITIRLDANGAFKPNEALNLLREYSRFQIQSIEQPIKPGQGEMEELCRRSPIPIAFDEELIGKTDPREKRELLKKMKPSFVILKPTLHGGLSGCREWIALAEKAGTGWWITSALESNIGLNAICQFTAGYPITIPQGLGTGMIYENNIPSPLVIDPAGIRTDVRRRWEIPEEMR